MATRPSLFLTQRIKFVAKQYIKMFIQGVVLPLFYELYKLITVYDDNLVVFADSHHDTLPFSMQAMYDEMEKQGYRIVKYISNAKKMSSWNELLFMIRFMKIYAEAKYIFVCDNFLPVSSCKKRCETMVVQLWHASGALKKFGYDAVDDIPPLYKFNPYKNYDLVTVSSAYCIKYYSQAMRIDESRIKATGISRSDVFFDDMYLKRCREHFYDRYPQAQNKKIILWAPTFRGNAGSPYLVGENVIIDMMENKQEYFWVIKTHPHLESESILSDCSIPTEQLLPVVDLLITDYSTVFFDFCLLKKPTVFFVPDYDEYMKRRGFYTSLSSLPGIIATDFGELSQSIDKLMNNKADIYESDYMKCIDLHMSQCDGHATKRILDFVRETERR